jgi:peptidoglycan/LPS O-acetylase OafA/YrhL
LTLATVVAALSISPEIFYSRSLFVGFIAVLCVASWCSYRWFEAPLQCRLRKRYAGRAVRDYVR